MKKSMLALAVSTACVLPAHASTSISGGVWFNYQNLLEKDEFSQLDDDTNGTVHNEALIIYADHTVEDSGWQLSAEWRTGQGSFSEPANNNSGDTSGFHKLWVGYNFSEERRILIGKSQVPFGWETINFWPGDIGLGGYADQMDVGVKFSDQLSAVNYDLAFYISDDFGETSTDTQDDNAHWGSSDTYRKVNTGVANLGYTIAPGSQVGVSYQKGELQDLRAARDTSDTTFGGHDAWNIWYKGQYGDLAVKAQLLGTKREGLEKIGAGPEDVETTRHAMSVAYASGPWNYYVEYTGTISGTDGNSNDALSGWAPGVSYNYGPGWFYVEYLHQKNFIDRNGDVSGDNTKFSALYLTVDYYF